MEHGPFTIGAAVGVSTILGWVQRGTRITWAVDRDVDRLITGVARNLGDQNGNVVSGADVRDLYLRVSGTFEYFLPVPDVVEMLKDGYVFEER